ncbi:MAG: type IV pilus assembly protein PilM [Candidatus Taylorbacteria bacterium]|nr:type IV pilus assembly protein PilM [Candidatus Taylorbacteria bacterium]
MSNFLQNFFKAPDESVVGIDVGSSSVKVVQLRKKKGRAILETYGELALGPYAGFSVGQATNLPAEKIAEAIKDVLREANVTTVSAGVSIPFKSSLVSLIELPKVDQKQLQEMIPMEARKYIPVPISEVTMDWWVVPGEYDDELDFVQGVDEDNNRTQPNDRKVQVLVVSIHNDVLSTYSKIVQDASLSASFFEIEMFSTTRSLLSGEVNPVLIFDMGASSTKVYILDRGVVKYSHIINKGSQEITVSISKGLNVTFDRAEHIKRNLGTSSPQEEKNVYEIISLTLDYIFSEANTVILNYQRRFNKPVSKVILTGGGVAMKGVFELAKANFQTEVVMGDPFLKVEAPAFLEDVLKVTGLEFSTALGLALRKLQELG